MGLLFFEKYPFEVCSSHVFLRDSVAHVSDGGIEFNPDLNLTHDQKEKISAVVAEAKEKGKEY